MYAFLYDPNLSGAIEFQVGSLDEVSAILAGVGSWQNIPGTTGAVLLSDPEFRLFEHYPEEGQLPEIIMRRADTGDD